MHTEHYLRYGTAAEQKYMKEYKHTYNGIAINGSMLAHNSKSISAFLHKELIGPNLIIDPMTHAFQHNIDNILNKYDEVKSSVKKLVEIYDEPIKPAIDRFRSVAPTDFTAKNLDGFVRRVLGFQMEHLKIKLDEKYQEYIEYSGMYREPSLLIAPYFYLTPTSLDTWLDLNCRLLETSISLKGDFKEKPIYAQLVISRELLVDSDAMKRIVSCLSSADGLLYWVDGLDETKATIDELNAVKTLVTEFTKANPTKKIISLYGGYFTELLLKLGLSGVIHGLEYGENREVIPVGGGIPQSKFYLPALRKRIPAPTMLGILRHFNISSPESFFAEICECRICKKIIKSTPIVADFNEFIKVNPEAKIIRYKKSGNIREMSFPAKESKEKCLFHYLEVKHREISAISKKSLKTLLGELRDAHTKFSDYFPENEIVYLNNWLKVLSA